MTDPNDDLPLVASIKIDEDEIDLSNQQWDDAIVLILFWVLAGVVFLQFFTRYVMHNDEMATWDQETYDRLQAIK